ncbi:MAG: hypothetical protein QNJ91_00135 [Gammaproteobacteria bacterium]|nr:hypothetical protein [Gammaproteobacteria bacterium]
MHSVVTDWADAATIDGRQCAPYVRGECLYEDLDDGAVMIVPGVKYGTWSRQAGFRRAPVRMPSFDARVREQRDRLLAAVRQHADDLPFALVDRFELWLLHATTGVPLALIASACDAAACDPPGTPRCTRGQRCLAGLPSTPPPGRSPLRISRRCTSTPGHCRPRSGRCCSACSTGRHRQSCTCGYSVTRPVCVSNARRAATPCASPNSCRCARA